MTIRKTSKFLSYVLRHKPDAIGITLDDNGWVDLETLIRASRAKGQALNRELIERVVANNDKQRFVIRNGKIRANQGHSIDIELQLPVSEPPDCLYHGTASKHVESILSDGLARMNRQHVHLSFDVETAINVGRRHGQPVVFKINAKEMFELGHEFYLSENKVWLVNEVPVSFIELIDSVT